MLGGHEEDREVLEEDQNFLEDSVQDEKTKKRKIARALQILHIRQSKFQSLCDASRHDKINELLDNALKERTEAFDLWGRLGIPDIPKSGYPTLEDVDIKIIHEAFQFLNRSFVAEFIPQKKKPQANLSLTMDDLKANNVGRSETSGKYEKLISRKTSLQPKIQPRRKSLRRRSHQVEDEKSKKDGYGSSSRSSRRSSSDDFNKLYLPNHRAISKSPSRSRPTTANLPLSTIDEPETPSAELARSILKFDFNDLQETKESPTTTSTPLLEEQVVPKDSMFNLEEISKNMAENGDNSKFLEPPEALLQRKGSRKSARKKKITDDNTKPYSVIRPNMSKIVTRKATLKEAVIGCMIELETALGNRRKPEKIDKLFEELNKKFEEFRELLFEDFANKSDKEQNDAVVESSNITDRITRIRIQIHRYKRK